MTTLDWGILLAFALVNVFSFALMGADKWKAKRGAWRVSEKALLLSCALFGALGGVAGMRVFRHKTRHAKFTVTVPALMLLQLALLAAYFVYWR